jgi:hypothetical protein
MRFRTENLGFCATELHISSDGRLFKKQSRNTFIRALTPIFSAKAARFSLGTNT